MAVPAQTVIKDGNNVAQNLNSPLNPGRAVAAESRPVALSTEDKASLDALNTDLGAPADTAATTDAGTFSLIALIKRGLASLTTSNTNTSNAATYIGPTSATAANADTGSFSLNALVKRALAGLTTLLAQTAKGITTKVAAQSVNPASDADPFPILVFQPTAAPTVLAVSTTSVNGALPAGAIIRISNGSSVPVCVAFGNSGIVATNSDMDVLPGNAECFRPPAGATHIAAIMAQGTTTLKVTPGNGA